ncbi:MAG TPA: PilN domain-containing protein [Gammaproteobacteria bacterium]|nr:PilN domain-containing protein [Gammaproteobacteria bacterium]
MPRINLLPWREQLRQKRKKDFITAIIGAVLIGGLLAYGSKLGVQAQIRAQNARNEILRAEITELDKQIAEILGLENQKERLLARMEIIEQLQKARPEVVHLFDELVAMLPEGVHLTEIRQTGSRIELQGTAQSSTRVSALMRNIDSSQWLRNPALDVVETVDLGSMRNAQFTLFMEQIPMNDEDAGAAGQTARTGGQAGGVARR